MQRHMQARSRLAVTNFDREAGGCILASRGLLRLSRPVRAPNVIDLEDMSTTTPPPTLDTAAIANAPAVPTEAPLDPPTTVLGKLRRLGPGMILAGAIVGSGELIATPKVAAEAGFWLLWLIVLGCTLKVFTQIEMGRHAITWGQTSLEAINSLPGPRFRVHWIVWYWFAVLVLIVSQNGGIIGGVGQALAMWKPLTADGREYNRIHDQLVRTR